MARPITLRQIEAFKAVIENGTIRRGSEMLNISQPAMSKLITHLEADSGLRLFERLRGRLAPTPRAMRLYEEIGRIFAGVRQVENAIDAIRREEQGRLTIGVIPALGSAFIQRATANFLTNHPNVFCTVQSVSSQWIVDRAISRKMDIGVVSAAIVNPNVILEPLMEYPLVCIMPLDHPLTAKKVIKPKDLQQTSFVSLEPDTYFGRLVEGMFEAHAIEPKIVLVADTLPLLCEFVAVDLGVSLVHPLVASGFQDRLAVRRFEPEILNNFQICRSVDGGNTQLVDVYVQELRTTAAQISHSMLSKFDLNDPNLNR